ncbi:MAG: cytidylate kinase family protein [Bacteroidia bacterium]|nr:cytidylate kinase family protein [Bacteroidia bacterium]
MKTNNLTIRALILIIGLFIMSFGVALSIRSNLGTTPISSVPYVYNYIFPQLSVGTFTILLNLIFLAIQAILLKKKFTLLHFLQIPAVMVFGGFVDLSLILIETWTPTNYVIQWMFSIASCFVIAFGIFLQVKANVTLLPAEGVSMALVETLKKDFGKVKIGLDSSLVALSLVSSILFLGGLFGVREGTLAAAFLVGFILQFYQKKLTFINAIIEPKATQIFVKEPYMTTDNFVITISRQFGSGGHAIGELIAKKLGVTFYDSKLINLTAEASGFTPEYVKEHEQKITNGLLYKLYKQNYAYVNEAIPPQDLLFMVQTRVIRDIAAKESCVIVGRAADYILKGHPNCFNIFIHADKEFRINRAIKEYNISPNDVQKELQHKDHYRMNYSKEYTGRAWADLNNYDLTLESSLFGIDITAEMIIDAWKKTER